jgi:hypothetical protein
MFRGQPKPAPRPQTPLPPIPKGFADFSQGHLRRWAIEQAIAARTHDCSHVQLIDAAEAIYNFALGAVHVIDPGKPSE